MLCLSKIEQHSCRELFLLGVLKCGTQKQSQEISCSWTSCTPPPSSKQDLIKVNMCFFACNSSLRKFFFSQISWLLRPFKTMYNIRKVLRSSFLSAGKNLKVVGNVQNCQSRAKEPAHLGSHKWNNQSSQHLGSSLLQVDGWDQRQISRTCCVSRKIVQNLVAWQS